MAELETKKRKYKNKTTTKTGKEVLFDENGNRLTLDGKPDKRSVTAKKNGRKSPVIKDVLDLGNPEDNARRIAFVVELVQLPPIDIHDVSQLEERLSQYLAICYKHGMKTGNQAMALALGMDAKTIVAWSNGNAPTPLLTEFAKKARGLCATFREGYMQDGKVNPVTGIFWQKNYDGLQDKQEVEVRTHDALGERQDQAQLAQRYLASLPDRSVDAGAADPVRGSEDQE